MTTISPYPIEEANAEPSCKFDHLQFYVDQLKPLVYYKAIEARCNTFASAMPDKNGRRDLRLARAAWCHMSFFSYHNGAQGIGVLGFEVEYGALALILERYHRLHPKLLVDSKVHQADGMRLLEVYAYYTGAKGVSEADTGTRIRFVERDAEAGAHAMHPNTLLPGLRAEAATFPDGVQPAYADHWVSNVRSREAFLETLHETLGFVPKVDFNAGVVAAGEAQIESTVMGNTSTMTTRDPRAALADRSQIFLPTNNALSPVGHVHWYLDELGQGIQHAASRVGNLCAYVERANDMRAITGEGISFLQIPRTYYGLLEASLLMRGGVDGELLSEGEEQGLRETEAADVISRLQAAGLADAEGAVELEVTDAALEQALRAAPYFAGHGAMVVRVARRSRFVNLWRLMRDQLSEERYLAIVRNRILIDVQGDDVLMQIFTSVVLQRTPGTEAPFLEFIERVCATCDDNPSGSGVCKPIRPGCGGFGIRNFLTLFLSIEVSKALRDEQSAAARAADGEAAFHRRRVELYTQQLVESNPILTEISEYMTAEGEASRRDDAPAARQWAARKAAANEALQVCAAKFHRLMKDLRESGATQR